MILVIVLPIAALWPVCGHEFTTWDDQDTVQTNPTLTPVTLHSVAAWWTTTRMDLYVPVTYTTWGLIALAAWSPPTAATAGHLDPMPFHSANLILHVLSCWVVFELLRLLIGKTWPAAAGAMVFGLHPVQVEAVAWVSGLKDVLGGLLALLAIWQYLAAAAARPPLRAGVYDSGLQPPASRRWRYHYAAALLLFALAMLAKPNELIAPAIAGVLDVLLMGRSWRQALLWLWPWIILSAGCVVEGWLVQPPTGAPHNVAVYFRPLVAIASIGFYVRKLACPINLAVDYGLTPMLAAHSRWLVADAIFIAGAAAGLWFARRSARPAVAGAIVFLVALLPVLGFVTFDFQWFSTVADHYLYLPMFGVALMVAWAAARWRVPAMAVGAGLVVGCLGAVSFSQTQYWADTGSLFHRVETVNPDSAAAAEALSQEALRRGDVASAIDWANTTIRLRPGSPLGYIAAGLAYAKDRHPVPAIDAYRMALELNPRDPVTLNDLATELTQAGNLPDAESMARQAIALDRQFAAAHFNLGTILLHEQKFDESIAELRSAEALDPRSEQYTIFLADLLAATGHRQEAIEQFRAALRLYPDSIAARTGLQQALASPAK